MIRIFALFLVLLTSACGFTPVYGTLGNNQSVGTEDILSYIAIENIPDREGQYLRNVLIDRFYRKERPANTQYSLLIQELTETKRDLDITESSDATRGQLRMEARMILRDKKTGEKLIDREISAIASYNILGSEFATRISEQSMRENALDSLARQIETRLSLYFRHELQE